MSTDGEKSLKKPLEMWNPEKNLLWAYVNQFPEPEVEYEKRTP